MEKLTQHLLDRAYLYEDPATYAAAVRDTMRAVAEWNLTREQQGGTNPRAEAAS